MSEDSPLRLYAIRVEAVARFEAAQSSPEENRYIFSYQITIHNMGEVAAKLLSRHWYITDANGNLEEAEGEGVVGEQPNLGPGESFEYSSGCSLNTPFGSMRGKYQMRAEDGTEFEADIPEFYLVGPRTLH